MDQKISPTTIDLIRHGEPLGGPMFRGSQDDPLSDLGWQQMRTAVEPHTPWQQIITSPLLRCCEFARWLADEHQIPMTIIDGFQEIHFGEWEGLTVQAAHEQYSEQLTALWNAPLDNTPPGGEPLLDFQQRVTQAWDELLPTCTGQDLLLVAHGGTIRVILCHVLSIPLDNMWRIDVPYAALSRIRIWTNPDGDYTYSLLSHAASL